MAKLTFFASFLVLSIYEVSAQKEVDDIACSPFSTFQFEGSSGVILSPGYLDNQNYSNNLDCKYTFAASPGEVVQFRVNDFDLEPSETCEMDHVHIVDQGLTLKVMCGNYKPYDFSSFSNRVLLVFKTDFMGTGSGFSISFRISRTIDICRSGQWRCLNDKCVPISVLCNEVQDCGDGSDEAMCIHRQQTPVSCGTSPIKPDLSSFSDRVVGGREAVPGSWPWQADLQIRLIVPSGHTCGGILIDDQWILTAAHCFAQMRHYSDWRVTLGRHHKFSVHGQSQIRAVAKLFIYGISETEFLETGRFSFQDDIALMKLVSPIEFSDYVRPACLPPLGYEVKPGTKCYATGWGATRGTGGNDVLKQTEMIVYDTKKCETDFILERQTTDPLTINNETMICAGIMEGGPGVCFGDSGGPLVCEDSGQWYVTGISSFVTAANGLEGVCGLAGSPSGFTKVSQRVNWIYRIVRINS